MRQQGGAPAGQADDALLGELSRKGRLRAGTVVGRRQGRQAGARQSMVTKAASAARCLPVQEAPLSAVHSLLPQLRLQLLCKRHGRLGAQAPRGQHLHTAAAVHAWEEGLREGSEGLAGRWGLVAVAEKDAVWGATCKQRTRTPAARLHILRRHRRQRLFIVPHVPAPRLGGHPQGVEGDLVRLVKAAGETSGG